MYFNVELYSLVMRIRVYDLASFCYNDIDVSTCVGDVLRGGLNATVLVDLLSRGSGECSYQKL